MKDIEREFEKELSATTIETERKQRLEALLNQAMKQMPTEKVEETKVKEKNVACKMLLKGCPNTLSDIVGKIIKSFEVRKTNGSIDYDKTKEYVATLMLEEVEK